MKIKKNVLAVIILVIFCITTYNANSQIENKYPNYKELKYKGLTYGIFKPIEYDKNETYPLVIVLNGFADTIPHDLVYYKKPFQKKNPSFVLTPISHGNPYEGGGWYDPIKETLLRDGKLAMEIVENTIEGYTIDINQIYIHGGSMGGIGTFGILSEFPEKFAAAYVVCGLAKMKTAKNFINVPLWIFHGQLDDAVPVQSSRNIYSEIIKQGGEKVRYTEYPGVKHNSWENSGNEKTLENWLFKQEKGKTAGEPEMPKGLNIEPNFLTNILRWELPKNLSNPDNEIWFYIILRNGEIITTVDGDIDTYKDFIGLDHNYYNYRLIAVNYYFKKSEPTESVRIKKY